MKQLTRLRLPYEGEWLTFWGGDTLTQNHHHENTAQRYGFDFVIVDSHGAMYEGDGTENEQYYSFGQAILAPGDGVVVEAIDGVRDNQPFDINTYSILGNYVMLQHNEQEFSVLGHLKRGSVGVRAGDAVVSGQQIGECGNSGQSSSAHLHYHVQDSSVFARLTDTYVRHDVARGIRVVFNNVIMCSGTKRVIKKEYSPVKGDILMPNSNALNPSSYT